jgi:hypothetical protein
MAVRVCTILDELRWAQPLGTAVKKNAEQRSILTLSTNVRDPRTVLRNNYQRDLKRVKLRDF